MNREATRHAAVPSSEVGNLKPPNYTKNPTKPKTLKIAGRISDNFEEGNTQK